MGDDRDVVAGKRGLLEKIKEMNLRNALKKN